MSINRVTITGNLTRDAELKATQGGAQVLRFSVAVNDRRKNQQTGEWEDVPNFVGCVMFGTRAEAISRYLRKGTKVAIEGKLRYSSWERDGQKRSKLEVVVDEIEFMSSRADGGQQGGYAPQQAQAQQAPYAPQPQQPYATSYQQPPYAPQATQPQAPELYDDEIPF